MELYIYNITRNILNYVHLLEKFCRFSESQTVTVQGVPRLKSTLYIIFPEDELNPRTCFLGIPTVYIALCIKQLRILNQFQEKLQTKKFKYIFSIPVPRNIVQRLWQRGSFYVLLFCWIHRNHRPRWCLGLCRQSKLSCCQGQQTKQVQISSLCTQLLLYYHH